MKPLFGFSSLNFKMFFELKELENCRSKQKRDQNQTHDHGMHDIHSLIDQSMLGRKAKDRKVNYLNILSLSDKWCINKVQSIY